jgi:hypothetical protein
MKSRSDSRLEQAWHEFDQGNFMASMKLALPFSGEDNLEVLSLICCNFIEIGPWSESDQLIRELGGMGGRDYWLTHQTEQWIYSAFIARLDAHIEVETRAPFFLEQMMSLNRHLLGRAEPGAFYYTVRAIRLVFSTEEINQDLDALGDHLVAWIVEMQKREIIDIDGINDLVPAIQMTFSAAFDGPTGFNVTKRIVEALR